MWICLCILDFGICLGVELVPLEFVDGLRPVVDDDLCVGVLLSVLVGESAGVDVDDRVSIVSGICVVLSMCFGSFGSVFGEDRGVR